MTCKPSSALEMSDAAAMDERLCTLEAGVYCALAGVVEACEDIATHAAALGLGPRRIRARLLASDVRGRLGKSLDALAEQRALRDAALA